MPAGQTDRIGVEVDWTPTTRVSLSFDAGYNKTHAMAGFVDNFASPGEGIGGVSYVFAELDRETVDLTVRADVLFSRNLSLQLYAQPYLTIGEYSKPKRLAKPDSYEFEDVEGAPDFDPSSIGDYDFEYASVDVNAVLRWEYRPGQHALRGLEAGEELLRRRVLLRLRDSSRSSVPRRCSTASPRTRSSSSSPTGSRSRTRRLSHSAEGRREPRRPSA